MVCDVRLESIDQIQVLYVLLFFLFCLFVFLSPSRFANALAHICSNVYCTSQQAAVAAAAAALHNVGWTAVAFRHIFDVWMWLQALVCVHVFEFPML